MSGDVLHLTKTFFLKFQIANGKHLIHHQDLWLKMCRNRERETNIHSRRIALNGRIQKFIDVGKCNNLVEFASDFTSTHAENSTVQIYILSAGELRMKSSADLKQACYPALDLDPPGG